jgi:integrase
LLVFHLLLSTGQRISDIMAMRWAQFDGTRLHVTSIKTGVSASRRVPSDLLDMLKRKREGRTALTICTNRDGRPFGECAVWSAFKRILVKIGAPQLTVHGLRKTANVIRSSFLTAWQSGTYETSSCPCRGVYVRSGAVVCDRLDARLLIVGDGGAAPTVEVASKASPA